MNESTRRPCSMVSTSVYMCDLYVPLWRNVCHQIARNFYNGLHHLLRCQFLLQNLRKKNALKQITKKQLTIWMNLRAGTAQWPRSEVTTSFISAIFFFKFHAWKSEHAKSGIRRRGGTPKNKTVFFFLKKKKRTDARQRRLSRFCTIVVQTSVKFVLVPKIGARPETRNTETRKTQKVRLFFRQVFTPAHCYCVASTTEHDRLCNAHQRTEYTKKKLRPATVLTNMQGSRHLAGGLRGQWGLSNLPFCQRCTRGRSNRFVKKEKTIEIHYGREKR